ncbi:C6 transcription factor [Lasiodiplodia theobromae]|uniref:C6 transcription factor n=1 Tax=Lasiodiplodia theobromae TaxID=45133 RepID=UPI0015C3FC01|nr:C6 transcription factor [Lasiodiplodia theobromae]KAF4534218.1 C6 transcription factor [Lasiodiplodia theobromae]
MDSSRDNKIRKRVLQACNRCRLIKLKCNGSSPCGRCKANLAICVFGKREKHHYNSKTAVAPGCKERQVDSCPSVSQYCVLYTGWCDLMFQRGSSEEISNQLIITTVIQLSAWLMEFETLDLETVEGVYCFSEQCVISRDALTDAGREELRNMFVGAAEQRAKLNAQSQDLPTNAATTPRPIDYAYPTSIGQNSEPELESPTCVSQSRREPLPYSDPCLAPVVQSSCAVAVEDPTAGTTLMEDDHFIFTKYFYLDQADLTEENWVFPEEGVYLGD